MADKVEGTVKWFSNRKGFGFITPSSDNAPTKDDIFVHQSNIVTAMDTYRTLKDGFEVQFEVITDTNGKLKAENVTSADGSPCPGPEPRERRKRKKNKASSAERGEETAGETPAEKSDEADDSKPKDSTDEAPKGKGRRRNNKKKAEGKANNENNNNGNNAEKPQPKPSWENDLEDSVKESLESRKIKIIAGKAFLAIGDARVKLGNGGYAAFGHTSGMIAEGKFTCENNGKITATWNHVIKLDDASDWKGTTADAENDVLVVEFNLSDDSVEPTKQEDATKPVWGEGKTDPKEALENNGFQLRKAAFSHVPRRRRPNRGRRNNNNKKSDDKPAGESK